MLVMIPDPLRHAWDKIRILHHLTADHRMLLDEFIFFFRQFRRFIEDRILHCNIANVVEQRHIVQILHTLLVPAELSGYLTAAQRHTDGTAVGIPVLGVYGVGDGHNRLQGDLIHLLFLVLYPPVQSGKLQCFVHTQLYHRIRHRFYDQVSRPGPESSCTIRTLPAVQKQDNRNIRIFRIRFPSLQGRDTAALSHISV